MLRPRGLCCFGTIVTIVFVFLFAWLGQQEAEARRSGDRGGGSTAEARYSFSLTTFDPSGRLGQVERAQIAATMGPPIVFAAVACPDNDDHYGVSPGRGDNNNSRRRRSVLLIMAAPQVLPSPPSSGLVEDDGTPRFVRLTPELVVGHSGLSADGRFVLAKAQRLAVEHRYAYDEPIPASVLLEELSLLYQQYTMKAAARPLGVSLLVAHLPSSQCTADDDDKNEKPWGLFRLDPSGNVESLRDDEDAVIVMNGSYLERTQLRSRLEDLLKNYRSMTPINEETKGDLEREIAEALRAAIREEQAALLLIDEAPATTGPQPRSGGGVAVAEDRAAPAVIVAALSREVFTVRRYE